jgi:hypothetical protein
MAAFHWDYRFRLALTRARAAVPLIAMAAIRPMACAPKTCSFAAEKQSADKADQRQNDQGKASKRKHRAGFGPLALDPALTACHRARRKLEGTDMTAHKEGDPTTLNRLYGRSKGKPLRAGQQGLVDTLLPQIAVPLEGEVTAQRLFGEDRPLHFEIGFAASIWPFAPTCCPIMALSAPNPLSTAWPRP